MVTAKDMPGASRRKARDRPRPRNPDRLTPEQPTGPLYLNHFGQQCTQAAAVRYARARNPLGSLVNSAHHERTLPVPSFRTDDWGWDDAPFRPESGNVCRTRWGGKKRSEGAAQEAQASRGQEAP